MKDIEEYKGWSFRINNLGEYRYIGFVGKQKWKNTIEAAYQSFEHYMMKPELSSENDQSAAEDMLDYWHSQW